MLDNPRYVTIFLFIPPRHEGRFAIVTIRGAGCGGRLRRSVRGCEKHRERRRRSSGRLKSRGPGVAVLTSKGAGGSVAPVAVEVTHDPERWRKSRPPGRARNKPFQPLRAERRMFRRNRGDDTRVLSTFAHGAADALAHPAFRAPSFRGRRKRGLRAPPRRHNNRGDGACLSLRCGCLKFESGSRTARDVVPAQAGTHTPMAREKCAARMSDRTPARLSR